MNVLFLTIFDFESVKERNIYTDLLREFIKNGHYVCAISPAERKKKVKTHVVAERNFRNLRLRIGNLQKTNVIEKGISTVAVERQFIAAIKKYFSDVHFDLILYPTPPITFCKVVAFVKKRDGARAYLLLKDIFPQNAVDIGLMKKDGMFYRYFRAKEKKLYQVSDRIGCMSRANVAYLLEHNPQINRKKAEICPNCIEPVFMGISRAEKERIRKKYQIPLGRTVFIYGGNLGKPQGIPFMLKCLHTQRKNERAFFLIVGDGVEYGRIERYIGKYKPENVQLRRWLPKGDYDKVVAACDVGMIFLDYRFTIPNFPSRLLGYMQAQLPVLAVTDTVTDIGTAIVAGGFGWWCESVDTGHFACIVEQILNCEYDTVKKMKICSRQYLRSQYDVSKSYKQIITGR